MGTWQWDLATGRVRWSPRVEALFGVPTGSFGGTFDAFRALVDPGDLPRVDTRIAHTLASGEDYDVDFRVCWPDGSLRWLEAKGRLARDASGATTGMIGTVFDVTARKHAEADAHRAEERYRAIVEDQADLIVRWRADGTLTFVNGACARFRDKPIEAIVGTSFLAELSDADRADLLGHVATLTPRSPIATRVQSSSRGDGALHWHQWTNRGSFDEAGRLIEVQSVGRDITDLIRVEDELRKANRAYRILSRATHAIARAEDEATIFHGVCDIIVGETGYRTAWIGLARDDLAQTIEVAARAGADSIVLQTPMSWGETARPTFTGTVVRTGERFVVRHAATDARVADLGAVLTSLGFEAGMVLPLRAPAATRSGERAFGVLSVYAIEPDSFGDEEVALFEELADEITFGVEALRARAAHRRAEQDLVASEALLKQLIRHTPAAVAMVDNAMRYLQASDRWLVDYGLWGQDIIGRSHYEVFPDIPDRWKEIHRRCLAGEVQTCDEDPFERAAGGTEWLKWEVRPWLGADGAIGGMIMLTEVITAKKQAAAEHEAAQARLRESEERLRQVAENMREVVWLRDVATGNLLYVSPAFERIWGRSCEALLARGDLWLEGLHPEDRERAAEAARTQEVTGDYDVEYRVVRPDGSERWVHARAFPVRTETGAITRIVGVAEDITERRVIELQLQQRHRLEAVGQLAGGVAHDFNNILLVILMELDLILSSGEATSEIAASASEAKASAERAAHLTRQLLQFSRRQVMRFEAVDLNKVVSDVATMLQRVVRENVRITLALGTGPLMTMADAGMLEQVLVNLAVNARDAMPYGGQVRVSTALRAHEPGGVQDVDELAPGTYVCLTVADDGTGIAAEHLPRIFEPFFTTKDPGKGTGLGLATVFGIVKQHRGAVTVQSAPGHGTTFQVMLPAMPGARASATERPTRTRARPAAAPERPLILVVEDDTAVRRLTLRVLDNHHYRTLGAHDGEEALALWEANAGDVRLVVSDVVMPGGMSGHDLERELRARDPSLRVILTSGYDEELAGGSLGQGQVLLTKPYRPDELLTAVAKALASQDDRQVSLEAPST